MKRVKAEIRTIFTKYKVADTASVADTTVLAKIYDPYLNATGKRMGTTVKIIFAENHTQYKHTYPDMYFVNAAGERDNCSKNDAVRFYCRGTLPDQIARVKRAFRSDVSDQTLEFKMKLLDIPTNEIECQLCKQRFDFIEIDIDHDTISFMQLLGHFIAAHETSLKHVPLERSVEKKKDGVWTLCQPLRQRWQEAHAEFAILRALCKGCHTEHGLRK